MSPALQFAPFVASAAFLLVCFVSVRATLVLAHGPKADEAEGLADEPHL